MDVDTGEIRVSRWVGVFDIGTVVNAKTAASHLRGGVVMGLGIHMLDDPDPTMPLGVVGAGEVGITGVAAAVANAVHHATGKRIRTLPITLDAVRP